MPGIVAVLERGPDGLSGEIAGRIADRMYESSRLRRHIVDPGNGFALVILHNEKDFFGCLHSDDWLVAWYGRPLYNGRPLTPEIFGECEAYLGRDPDAFFANWYGHFQAVIYAKKRHELYAASDKISTQQLYYTEGKDFVALAPETLSLRALAAFGWRPAIRDGAIYEYLASGHLWGDGTFWDTVFRLGPGQYLHARPGGLSHRFYWQPVYRPSDEDEGSLRERLFKAIEKDISSLPPGRALLTLSGGADSRSLLGFLDAMEMPFGVVSYNFGDAYTASDAHVGEYYADKIGADHFFYDADLSDIDRLIDDIRRVIAATGGECDTVVGQDAFLGTRFYRTLAGDYDFLLRGDEIWGGHMHVTNSDMAFLDTYLYTLEEFRQPAKILSPEAFRQGVRYLKAQMQEYSREYPAAVRNADDLRDYLYWRHRETRLLQTMAYIRRVYIPHIAPFLLDHTVASTLVTPSRLRTDKQLFREMNRVGFPALFQDPSAPNPFMTESTRFDRIYRDPNVLALIRDALIENPPAAFRDLLDPERTEAWVASVTAGEATAIRAQNRLYNLLLTVRDIVSRSPSLSAHLEYLLVRSGLVKYPFLDSKYLFRLLVLALALREHEAVAATGAAASSGAETPSAVHDFPGRHALTGTGKSLISAEAQRQ
ncbi:hypothetical protein FGU65_14580 [Methanoculleus sp. FWC-SCC1]|uniref:Asparagine synthase (Glutamine-hydrolysing) n=1 Tax=Methanoculleus frigidifontis TaxID=2584085 RepID=A0ABT8MDS3_9EURY|nr:hypothetical protein [Methanoculleus sp. FWC-SCC1]MDN7026092.1 hypothetical protein [Methanoculleus sp. FWC-SCC1]